MKLVQYIKFAEHLTYGASEHLRAPRLILTGAERERVAAIIERTKAELAPRRGARRGLRCGAESMTEVVVVGAGIVGPACAYHLLQDGHRVTIFDRDPEGDRASHGNAGGIAVPEVVPASTRACGRACRAG